MKLHANAKLLVSQRKEVGRLNREEGVSYRNLAQRFGVNLSTIQRWARRETPLDLSTAPHRRREGLNNIQKEAILEYRKEYPGAGPKTIVAALAERHGKMSHATVGRFLQREGVAAPPPPKTPRKPEPLKVGRHRLQMDIQVLPAIRGGKNFEHKITIIHMATRVKYSEIHSSATSEVVAQVVKNALAHMPPFF